MEMMITLIKCRTPLQILISTLQEGGAVAGTEDVEYTEDVENLLGEVRGEHLLRPSSAREQ